MTRAHSFLMSEWESDLDRLLQQLPATARWDEIDALVSEIVQDRWPDAKQTERYEKRLICALAFLHNNNEEEWMQSLLVTGSSSSLVSGKLSRALFRWIMATPDDLLGQAIPHNKIIELMREDHRPD